MPGGAGGGSSPRPARGSPRPAACGARWAAGGARWAAVATVDSAVDMEAAERADTSVSLSAPCGSSVAGFVNKVVECTATAGGVPGSADAPPKCSSAAASKRKSPRTAASASLQRYAQLKNVDAPVVGKHNRRSPSTASLASSALWSAIGDSAAVKAITPQPKKMFSALVISAGVCPLKDRVLLPRFANTPTHTYPQPYQGAGTAGVHSDARSVSRDEQGGAQWVYLASCN